MTTVLYLILGGFTGATIVLGGCLMRMGSLCSRQEETAPTVPLNDGIYRWRAERDADDIREKQEIDSALAQMEKYL